MKTTVCLALSALLLAGCASALESGEMAKTSTPAGEPLEGIPYRVRDRILVEVYQLTDDGYTPVGHQLEDLADPTRLYFLNFRGQALSNANVKFEQRADGTLVKVHLADKKDFAALTAAGAAASSYATTRQTIAKDAQTKADDAKKKAHDAIVADEQAADSAVDLAYVARRADQLLAELPADAKLSDRIEAERIAANARRMANKAARDAGQDEPFPGS